jgi:DNA polymerase-3 subunit delta
MTVKKPRKTDKTRFAVYVVAGKDESMVGVECGLLLDELVKPADRAVGLLSVDGDEVAVAEVFDELRTLPFLTATRVVLVRRADGFVSENRQLLESYFDNPCPTGTLILAVSSWPSNTRLARKLGAVGQLVSAEQPKGRALSAKLGTYCQGRYGKPLEPAAAELLVELAGPSLPRLFREVDKLAAYSDGNGPVDAADVEVLVGQSRLENAFAVIDAAFAGRTAGAIGRLRAMFEMDRSAGYTIVGAFAYCLRRLFRAKVLQQKGLSDRRIADQLRIWRNAESLLKRARAVSLERIGGMLRSLSETDLAIKTGRTTPQVAAERLIFELASPGTGPAAGRGGI